MLSMPAKDIVHAFTVPYGVFEYMKINCLQKLINSGVSSL